MTEYAWPAPDDPIWMCAKHQQRRRVSHAGTAPIWICQTCEKTENSWHDAVWPFTDAIKSIYPAARRIEITVTDDQGQMVQHCICTTNIPATVT